MGRVKVRIPFRTSWILDTRIFALSDRGHTHGHGTGDYMLIHSACLLLLCVPWTLLQRPSRPQKRWGSCNDDSLFQTPDLVFFLRPCSSGSQTQGGPMCLFIGTLLFSQKNWVRAKKIGKMAVVRLRPLALCFLKYMQQSENTFDHRLSIKKRQFFSRNLRRSQYIVVGQQQPVPSQTGKVLQ